MNHNLYEYKIYIYELKMLYFYPGISVLQLM